MWIYITWFLKIIGVQDKEVRRRDIKRFRTTLARLLSWSIVPYTERLRVQSPVKAQTWVAGSFPSLGTYRRQQMGASLSHRCFFLILIFFSFPSSFSKKFNKPILGWGLLAQFYLDILFRYGKDLKNIVLHILGSTGSERNTSALATFEPGSTWCTCYSAEASGLGTVVALGGQYFKSIVMSIWVLPLFYFVTLDTVQLF